MIRDEIKKLIEKSIKKLQKERVLLKFNISEIEVKHPEEKAHGDYATNIALRIGKDAKKEAMEIAELLSSELKSQDGSKLFEKVETAKPGFINFFLSKSVFEDELNKILTQGDNYGSSNVGHGKTVIVEYSSPNIAKPFSIGHLRSTIIGQAIYNLYKFLGYKVVGINHLGDWGTQFGKLIYAIEAWGDKEKIAKDPIKELTKLYVRFHEESESKPELEEEGRKWFKKLEEGNKEVRATWKKSVEWSLKEFNRIYELLGVKIDLVLGESFYQPMLKDVIKEALDNKIAIKSRGAIIISFPKDILPPLMIQKSDGTTLYSTRDLATIKYRREKFRPFKIIYEVGADQTLYFKQLFLASELLGFGRKEDYFHVAHGLMRLSGGRMRTRKGDIILLEDVLKEAIERAGRIAEDKNQGLNKNEKEEIAKAIGIGAVKYNDLSYHYSTDIVFDWDKVLNLKGNSGPYLQYAYVRGRSVLRKSGLKKNFKAGELKEKEEIQVLKLLSQFPEVIERSAKDYSPSLLCNFLFELAQSFNTFYESLPILEAETDELKKARLSLVEGICQIIKNGLNILGISTPEKM
ncbi:MAG: arginine--tRNA ligase [Patescibacteria group bacterium]|nr:arginine--tRNA ligase [Patescibacteria group bacterium]